MFVAPAVSFRGAVALPGDKSLSHRALLIGAICERETVVRGFGHSASASTKTGGTRSASTAPAYAASRRPRVRSTAATPARSSA